MYYEVLDSTPNVNLEDSLVGVGVPIQRINQEAFVAMRMRTRRRCAVATLTSAT